MIPSSFTRFSSGTRCEPLPTTTSPAAASAFVISANARIDAATFFSFSNRATTSTNFLKCGYRERRSSGSAFLRLSRSTKTGNTVTGALMPRAASESAILFETTRTESARDKRNRARRTLRRLPSESPPKYGSKRSVCTCRWSLLPRIHAMMKPTRPVKKGSWAETTSGRWSRQPAAMVRREPKTRPRPNPRTEAFPDIWTSCSGPWGTKTSMRSTVRACIWRRLATALDSLKAFQSVESTSTRIGAF